MLGHWWEIEVSAAAVSILKHYHAMGEKGISGFPFLIMSGGYSPFNFQSNKPSNEGINS